MIWPDGYDRQLRDEVASTNAEAVAQFDHLTRPTWICARRQVAGHGRRGRSWATPPGNFAASLAMRVSEPPAEVALRSFVAALALFDAVRAVSGRFDGLALKWPNDVLLNGGKLAGILLESPGPGRLIIGIGVNLVEAPEPDTLEPGAVPPVALAAETGALVMPAEFLDALAAAYAHHESVFVSEGFAPIRSAWLARAARLGEEITARAGGQETVGIFETVDARGQLVLKTAQGPRQIAAADIFF